MIEYIKNYYINLEYGYSYITTWIIYIICTILLLNDIPKTRKSIMYKLLEILIAFLILLGLNSIYYSITGLDNSQLSMLVFIFLYAVIFSKYKLSTRIVMSSIFYCTNLQGIIISCALAEVISESNFPLAGVMSKFDITSAVVIATFVLVLLFLKRFSTESFNIIPRFYVLLIVMVSAISFVIFTLDLKDNIAIRYMVIISISFWSLDILAYGMFYLSSKEYNEKLNLIVLQHKGEAEREQFRISMKTYDEMRILRHELKNHFSYAEILLEQKDYKKLDDYFTTFQEKVTNLVQYIDCGNAVINSSINYMYSKAKERGIRLETDFTVPKTLPIDESELYSLLSNIVENAIEACVRGQCKDAVIKINIRQEQGYLFLRVSNPIGEEMSVEERLRLETSKADQQMHGFGTKIIKMIVEKNKGLIKYSISEGKFIVDAMLESNINNNI